MPVTSEAMANWLVPVLGWAYPLSTTGGGGNPPHPQVAQLAVAAAVPSCWAPPQAVRARRTRSERRVNNPKPD